jgi:hypothetical protein
MRSPLSRYRHSKTFAKFEVSPSIPSIKSSLQSMFLTKVHAEMLLHHFFTHATTYPCKKTFKNLAILQQKRQKTIENDVN